MKKSETLEIKKLSTALHRVDETQSSSAATIVDLRAAKHAANRSELQ